MKELDQSYLTDGNPPPTTPVPVVSIFSPRRPTKSSRKAKIIIMNMMMTFVWLKGARWWFRIFALESVIRFCEYAVHQKKASGSY